MGLLHNSADGGDGAADEALLTANHLSQLHDSPQATCHIQHNKLSTTNIQRRLPSADHLSQLRDRAHRLCYKPVMPPPPPWARHVAVLTLFWSGLPLWPSNTPYRPVRACLGDETVL